MKNPLLNVILDPPPGKWWKQNWEQNPIEQGVLPEKENPEQKN